MPTLLQINSTVNWGSTGKIVEQIGRLALTRGWKVDVAYGRYWNPSQLGMIKVGRKLNPYFHYLTSLFWDAEGLGSRLATRRLIKKIKSINPDIVHLHNIHDHWLNYRILFEYLNATDIKVVWTFHDCWAFTGHCFHFAFKGCDKWKVLCDDCPLTRVYPQSCIDRSKRNYLLKKKFFSVNKNLTIVACSDWIARYVSESYLRGKNLIVIHNGIDTALFSPVMSQTKKSGYNILAVSNVWNREKGIDDIFRLREMLPSDYLITMVGLSKEQLKDLPEGIIGFERTSTVADLIRLYSDADVFINTSYAETFPTVNLEALSCGTPVITYNTGGSPETIDDTTGIVVPCGDVEALANAIKNLRINPLNSADCRNRAVERFDKQNFIKYVNLYESLI